MMHICHSILVPVIVVIRTLVEVVTEIIRTVCEWITTTITFAKEVCEEISNILGPFSFLVDWACKIIEWVETSVEWLCEEVVDRILTWVEQLVEYLFYILTWVCWVISLPFRIIGVLLCRIGFGGRRIMRICVKVLTEANGNPGVPLADVQNMMADAAAILANCNITLVVVSNETIAKEEYLDTTTCSFGGMFSGFFAWFSRNACQERCTVTVYFVRDIISFSGCAYPGTNWVTVDAGGDGSTVVQEIGHLADLWGHTSDPNNVMTNVGGGTHDQITPSQCCTIRTSRFSCPAIPLRIGRVRLESATVVPSISPFRRKEGAPESKEG